MSYPMLVAGLVLLIAGSHWFPNAGMAGLISAIAGAVGLSMTVWAAWKTTRRGSLALLIRRRSGKH